MKKTTSINAYVQFSDYVDVDIDIDDVINEISDDDLIKELSRRKIHFAKPESNPTLKKEAICDLFGVNYHTDKEQLKKLMCDYINEL